VIRLFGRIKALKNILTALTASIVPVLNAFLIMLVIAAICERKFLIPVCQTTIFCIRGMRLCLPVVDGWDQGMIKQVDNWKAHRGCATKKLGKDDQK
jgi:hypothetical protein